MNKEIVDNKHKYWRALYVRLNDGLVKRGCNHTFDLTEQILFSLPDVDVGGTLEFLMDHGGYCDCEVYMNVFSDEPEPKRAE